MDDNLNMLMRRLLDESSQHREQLQSIQRDLFTKTEFERFSDKLDLTFQAWDAKVTAVDETQQKQAARINEVWKWKGGIVNGFTWFLRASVVALLGLLVALVPFHWGVADNQRPIVTPMPIARPEYVPQIKKTSH